MVNGLLVYTVGILITCFIVGAAYKAENREIEDESDVLFIVCIVVLWPLSVVVSICYWTFQLGSYVVSKRSSK